MLINDRRIRIISGDYGSGKTEFAVNYAVALRKISDKAVVLSDLDIINVYFRSREKTKMLEDMGIKIYSTSLKDANVDLPALSAAVITPMRTKNCEYVIDLGGDVAGTRVLGRLKPYYDENEIDFFMVINTMRPDTDTVEKIIMKQRLLEEGAQLKVTGYVNNTNLIRETNLSVIEEGDKIIKKVSEKTKVPIRYCSYVRDLFFMQKTNLSGELFPMDFYMREDWM